mgnify:CR=1 FL=1
MKKTIKDVSPECKSDFGLALSVVTTICKVSRTKILGKHRLREIITARNIMYALMDSIDKHDYASIGATVIHGLREHENFYEKNYDRYADIYEMCLKSFNSQLNHDKENMTEYDKSHFEILQKIDSIIKGLNVVRESVVDDFISGIPINSELKKKLVEAFFIPNPESDSTNREKEMAGEIFINKKKYDKH